MESLAYRLVACCHLHTLTSGAWHLELQGQGLATWRAMERLQEGEGRGHRTVRWRSEVSVPRALRSRKAASTANLIDKDMSGYEDGNQTAEKDLTTVEDLMCDLVWGPCDDD